MGRWGKPSCYTPPFKLSVRHRFEAALLRVLLAFDVDPVLLPTAPDEDLGLWVNLEPAIALVVTRPLDLADFPLRVAERAATILANSIASLTVMFETAGGVLMVLYFIADILSPFSVNVN